VEKPIYRFLHLVFALGTLHLMVLAGLEAQRFFQTRTAIQTTQASVERLNQQITNLAEEVDAAEDPTYKEAMIRRMGFVRKDEQLFLKQ
jgi:outer membrane murein-binding lipoprotein Lpp